MAALELAIAHRADALEFDLHTAANGDPFLFHDETVDRTTDGSGRIGELEPHEIARLDAGAWFDPRFRGEPVPSLPQALHRVRERVPRIYPEIKEYRAIEDVDRIADAVATAGMLDHAVFISMDWAALERVRGAQPGARIGYIVEHADRANDAIARATGDEHALLDFDQRILVREPVWAEGVHAAGIELAVWTVNDIETAARLLDIGVRRFTTNEVEALVTWKATLA